MALYTTSSLVAQLILRMLEHLEQEHRATGAEPGEAEGEDTCTISTDAVSYSAISDDSDFGRVCLQRLLSR